MNTKGFTLVEVLIALFIAVVAAVYVAKTVTGTNKVVAAGRDTFIATNLAHESLDLTRAMRDTTWFKFTNPSNRPQLWMTLSRICQGTGKYTYLIDTDMVRNFPYTLSGVRPTNQPAVLYVQNNKLWTHTESGGLTPYKRILEADCEQVQAAPAFVTITSTVSWKGQNGQDKSVSIKEQLYNWLP